MTKKELLIVKSNIEQANSFFEAVDLQCGKSEWIDIEGGGDQLLYGQGISDNCLQGIFSRITSYIHRKYMKLVFWDLRHIIYIEIQYLLPSCLVIIEVICECVHAIHQSLQGYLRIKFRGCKADVRRSIAFLTGKHLDWSYVTSVTLSDYWKLFVTISSSDCTICRWYKSVNSLKSLSFLQVY